MELVVLVGLQGAGKTTFYLDRFAATHVHVSKDNFRNNRNRDRRQRQLITEALSAGRSVVVDNTNPTRLERAELIKLGRELGASVRCFFLSTQLSICVAWNSRRDGKARVPVVAICAASKRLQPPGPDEGFDSVEYVYPTQGGA